MNRQRLACESAAACRNRSSGSDTAVSPALAAAQEKLERLRKAHRPDQMNRQTQTPIQVGRFQPPDTPGTNQTRPNALPDHLGWHSTAVTDVYRRVANRPPAEHEAAKVDWPHCRPEFSPPPPPEEPSVEESFVKLPPDIGLALLREKLASPGRVWLLLRYLDQDGKGWVEAGEARKRLADEESDTAVCGRRQLRNLLAAGDGLFWERDEERIWLRSMARVATGLGLSRLNGRPVKLPLPILLESIGTVRAHLYAAFHSSRQASEDEAASKPISRERLKQLSSATRRTQQLYEEKANVRRQVNYAVGPAHTIEAEQELAWQHGRALFRFTDKKGNIGKPGQQYLAWQLPNSYDGPHQILPKGYQRQINCQLTDLLNEGTTGNGEIEGDSRVGGPEVGSKRPLFYQNGSAAAKQYNREPEQDLYWRDQKRQNRFGFWHHIPALNGRKQAE